MSKKAIEHRIGDTIPGSDIDKGVQRVAEGTFSVVVGSSCVLCAFSGLGHRTCRLVKCTQHDRSDGLSVVYKEIES